MVRLRPSGWFHLAWLPFCRVSTNPRMRATRWNSRAVALGIHYLSGISGKPLAFFAVFFLNHAKDACQFSERLFTRLHEGVATTNRGDFSNPPGAVILAVENDFVVVKLH